MSSHNQNVITIEVKKKERQVRSESTEEEKEVKKVIRSEHSKGLVKVEEVRGTELVVQQEVGSKASLGPLPVDLLFQQVPVVAMLHRDLGIREVVLSSIKNVNVYAYIK